MSREAGFTLTELVITIVILSFLALVLIPFYQAISHGPEPALRQQAVALGQAMMDEIVSKKWDGNSPAGGGPICSGESDDSRPSIEDCGLNATLPGLLGPEGGESRADFDDVDDYAYYDANPETGSFQDQNGDSFSMPGFSRRVEVRYIASSSDPINHQTPAAAGTTDSKLIVVTITTPQQETYYWVAAACNL